MKAISVLDFEEYRGFLRAVLAEKGQRGFSLRAFARAAGLSPSHLSRTLSGQKKLSAAAAHKLSVALNQSPEESDRLLSLIELEKTSDGQRRTKILKRMNGHAARQPSTVSLDVFRVVADWYYFAIVALTETRAFRGDSYWVARRLGIQPFEARLALERLLKLGFIKKRGRQFAPGQEEDISTTDDLASAAIKENHGQHLALAQRALHEVPLELREFNNLTLAMDPADAPRAKKMVRDFVDRFQREFKRGAAPEIFQLNVQLYQLSKSTEEQK